MAIIKSVTDLIGNTPIMPLYGLTKKNQPMIYIKNEAYNPGGSIKDRPAIHIINDAEKKGYLKKGGMVIESSSGNFGVALAMICAARGYQCIICVDPLSNKTNIAALKAFGAKVEMVTQKKKSEATYQKARKKKLQELARIYPDALITGQHDNPLNPQAHAKHTAKEIIREFPNGDMHTLVATISTCGHISGIARGLKNLGAKCQIVAVDTKGSKIFGYGGKATEIKGMGLEWIPGNLDKKLIDQAWLIDEQESFSMARYIGRNFGILLGGSSGAAIMVALAIALNGKKGENILAICPDRGEKYLHYFYDNMWMKKRKLKYNDNLEQLHHYARNLAPICFPNDKINQNENTKMS